MKDNKKGGFSLAELMTAATIISIFSAIAFMSLNSHRQRSRDAVRFQDLKNLSLAAQNYFSENFAFPPTMADMDKYFATGGASSVPQDPVTKANYFYKNYDVAGAHKYCVGAVMEIPKDDGVPDADPDCPVVPSGTNYIIKGP